MSVVNLFEKCDGLGFLREIYSLNNDQTCNIAKRAFPFMSQVDYPVDQFVRIFLEETNIHPDTYDISNIKLHCKHVSNHIDHGDFIRAKGLMTLTELLELDSPLHSFLAERDLELFPKDHYFLYNNRRFYLPSPDMSDTVPYWKAVDTLCYKLYSHHGEIEAFVCGEPSDLKKYSTVIRNPEILNTLDRMICSLYKAGLCHKESSFEKDWQAASTGCSLVEFDLKFIETGYIGDMTTPNYCSDSEWAAVEPFLSGHYENERDTPQMLWWNNWLIFHCLYNFAPEYSLPEKYISAKSDVRLGPDRITINSI